jgi:hypothetical protein
MDLGSTNHMNVFSQGCLGQAEPWVRGNPDVSDDDSSDTD